MAQPAGPRHQQRERALGLLYEAEAKGIGPGEALRDQPVEVSGFVAELVLGVEGHRRALDEMIGRHSVGWAVERMPVIDRLVLQIASYELMAGQAPPAVAISEAVELAKAYSTDDSARFVNGVLASVAAELAGQAR
ncbi:MAG: transcription antitermination factor NusB [Acidimicrobiales bacterium]